jgi:hypothetical protein
MHFITCQQAIKGSEKCTCCSLPRRGQQPLLSETIANANANANANAIAIVIANATDTVGALFVGSTTPAGTSTTSTTTTTTTDGH